MRNASTPPLLRLEDICVRFGFVEALKSVNLTIDRKEVIASWATTAPASPH